MIERCCPPCEAEQSRDTRPKHARTTVNIAVTPYLYVLRYGILELALWISITSRISCCAKCVLLHRSRPTPLQYGPSRLSEFTVLALALLVLVLVHGTVPQSADTSGTWQHQPTKQNAAHTYPPGRPAAHHIRVLTPEVYVFYCSLRTYRMSFSYNHHDYKSYTKAIAKK